MSSTSRPWSAPSIGKNIVISRSPIRTLPSPLSPLFSPHKNQHFDTIRSCKTCHISNGGPCSACQDYLKLDGVPHSTEQLDEEGLEKRRKFRMEINRVHDPLTHHFPSEITSAIFQYSLPDWNLGAVDHVDNSKATRNGGRRHLNSGPLLLGAVCQRWRHITWASPDLWTTLRLFLGRRHGEHTSRLNLAREWIERAGPQLPLSFVISWPSHDNANLRRWNTDDDLISLVNQYSSRWDKVELQGPSWLIALLTGDSKGAPNLSTLTIYPRHGKDYLFSLKGEKARPINVSIRCGSLKCLNIHWKYTTNVSAEFSIDECVELIRRAPQLQRCRFSMTKNSESFPLPEEFPITHHTLESLEFVFNQHTGTEVTQFLRIFTFPSLNSIKFDQRLELAWDVVLTHIKRSQCQLTSLEIKSQCEYDVLLAVLLNTPTLRHLSVTNSHADLFTLLGDTAVSATNDHLQGPFLPVLETINVWPYNDSIGDDFWDRILGIFGPRSITEHPHLHRRRPLKILHVNRFWHPNEGILSIGIDKRIAHRISELTNAGIILEVKDWNNRYNLLQLAIDHAGLS